MKTKKVIGVVLLVGLPLAISFWLGYLLGSDSVSRHDMFTAIALSLLAILVLARLGYAFFFRPGGESSSTMGGDSPPIAPIIIKPSTRPPSSPFLGHLRQQ